MGEWENYCGEIGEVCKDLQKQDARIEVLEAERDCRIREICKKENRTVMCGFYGNHELC